MNPLTETEIVAICFRLNLCTPLTRCPRRVLKFSATPDLFDHFSGRERAAQDHCRSCACECVMFMVMNSPRVRQVFQASGLKDSVQRSN